MLRLAINPSNLGQRSVPRSAASTTRIGRCVAAMLNASAMRAAAKPSVVSRTASCGRERWALRLLLACLIAFPITARAQGTLEEVKALAERAAAHLHAVGPKQAIADFNDLNGGYCDRNLFVVTYDQQHKVVSSARVPAYLGRDATRFVDEDGKEFGKAIITMAETNGAGWVDYRMTNPATMKVDLKTSYVIEVDGYVVFVGAYKP
jgi:cytochrome c